MFPIQILNVILSGVSGAKEEEEWARSQGEAQFLGLSRRRPNNLRQLFKWTRTLESLGLGRVRGCKWIVEFCMERQQPRVSEAQNVSIWERPKRPNRPEKSPISRDWETLKHLWRQKRRQEWSCSHLLFATQAVSQIYVPLKTFPIHPFL